MQKLRFVNANGDEIDFTDFENFGVTSWDGLDKTGSLGVEIFYIFFVLEPINIILLLFSVT